MGAIKFASTDSGIQFGSLNYVPSEQFRIDSAPSEMRRGGEYEITLLNDSEEPSSVTIDGVPVEIDSYESGKVTIAIPDEILIGYGSQTLTVTVDGVSDTHDFEFLPREGWLYVVLENPVVESTVFMGMQRPDPGNEPDLTDAIPETGQILEWTQFSDPDGYEIQHDATGIALIAPPEGKEEDLWDGSNTFNARLISPGEWISNTSTITLDDVELDVPVMPSDITVEVLEHTTELPNLGSSTNSEEHDYSIVGGADADKFEINPSTGYVEFKSAPDYEDPQGSAGNTYVFWRSDENSAGPAETPQIVTVNVTNDPSDDPTILLATTVYGGTRTSPSLYSGTVTYRVLTQDWELLDSGETDIEDGQFEIEINGENGVGYWLVMDGIDEGTVSGQLITATAAEGD